MQCALARKFFDQAVRRPGLSELPVPIFWLALSLSLSSVPLFSLLSPPVSRGFSSLDLGALKAPVPQARHTQPS
eukprot:3327009-Alexandrium_andersonii.AAC.1